MMRWRRRRGRGRMKAPLTPIQDHNFSRVTIKNQLFSFTHVSVSCLAAVSWYAHHSWQMAQRLWIVWKWERGAATQKTPKTQRCDAAFVLSFRPPLFNLASLGNNSLEYDQNKKWLKLKQTEPKATGSSKGICCMLSFWIVSFSPFSFLHSTIKTCFLVIELAGSAPQINAGFFKFLKIL